MSDIAKPLARTMFDIGIHSVKGVELSEIRTICQDQPPGQGQFHVRDLKVRTADQEFTLTLYTDSEALDGPECLAIHTDFDPEAS